MCLLGQVFQEKGVHPALESDVQMRNVALGQRDDVDAGEGEAFEESRGVFLVAAEAVQRLGQDDIESLVQIESPRVWVAKLMEHIQLRAPASLYRCAESLPRSDRYSSEKGGGGRPGVVERLMNLLTALDHDVEIVIRRKPRSRKAGRISVVAA
jgi:hypothetical protein